MKHYGRLILSPRWALCQRPESLQFIGHRPPLSSAEALALIHAKFFVVFQRIRPVTHRTNSNLMNRLNFGRSSLSHSFHTMFAPATISSLLPKEDAVQEVSHSMNVHFHFRVQQAGRIPDTEPWLTSSSSAAAFFHRSRKKKVTGARTFD